MQMGWQNPASFLGDIFTTAGAIPGGWRYGWPGQWGVVAVGSVCDLLCADVGRVRNSLPLQPLSLLRRRGKNFALSCQPWQLQVLEISPRADESFRALYDGFPHCYGLLYRPIGYRRLWDSILDGESGGVWHDAAMGYGRYYGGERGRVGLVFDYP